MVLLDDHLSLRAAGGASTLEQILSPILAVRGARPLLCSKTMAAGPVQRAVLMELVKRAGNQWSNHGSPSTRDGVGGHAPRLMTDLSRHAQPVAGRDGDQ
jgi:hypothetical protein